MWRFWNAFTPIVLHGAIIYHYSDVIMCAMSSLITSLTSVYSTVNSCADLRKNQSSALLAFVRGNHRRPVNSPHKWPVTRKMSPFGDVIIMRYACLIYAWLYTLKPVFHTVYPKKYAHGFVVLCFVVVMQSFIMNSHEVFIHIHQGCFAGTGAIVRLPQCQWSKPDGYGKISQCITTTKHSKTKTMCIFLGIYCMFPPIFTVEYKLWLMFFVLQTTENLIRKLYDGIISPQTFPKHRAN